MTLIPQFPGGTFQEHNGHTWAAVLISQCKYSTLPQLQKVVLDAVLNVRESIRSRLTGQLG
jgi:hypothetical protein